MTMEPFKRKLRRKEVKLNSVQHLQQLVRDGQHSGMCHGTAGDHHVMAG